MQIVSDNIQYAKCVKFMGTRDNAAGLDFSGILDEVRQRQFGKGEQGGIRKVAGRSGHVGEGSEVVGGRDGGFREEEDHSGRHSDNC